MGPLTGIEKLSLSIHSFTYFFRNRNLGSIRQTGKGVVSTHYCGFKSPPPRVLIISGSSQSGCKVRVVGICGLWERVLFQRGQIIGLMI